jgi:hypothetical protein
MQEKHKPSRDIHVCTFEYLWDNTRMYACVSLYPPTHTHACMYVFVPTPPPHTHTNMRACMLVCRCAPSPPTHTHTCVHVRLSMPLHHMCTYNTYILTKTHIVYIHTTSIYIHTCIPAYIVSHRDPTFPHHPETHE